MTNTNRRKRWPIAAPPCNWIRNRPHRTTAWAWCWPGWDVWTRPSRQFSEAARLDANDAFAALPVGPNSAETRARFGSRAKIFRLPCNLRRKIFNWSFYTARVLASAPNPQIRNGTEALALANLGPANWRATHSRWCSTRWPWPAPSWATLTGPCKPSSRPSNCPRPAARTMTRRPCNKNWNYMKSTSRGGSRLPAIKFYCNKMRLFLTSQRPAISFCNECHS